jgi:L-ascorbate metabolism protein UlaG (beta-lactamase superfamily)
MHQLHYFGHCAFQWVTTRGSKILIDPYRNSKIWHWFNKGFAGIETDVLLVTHPHFDHAAVNKVYGEFELISGPAVRHGTDYTITGIKGRHAKALRYSWWFWFKNTIFVIEVDGIRYCHWGDNRSSISDNLRQQIGKVDVLIVPIDGSEHLLKPREVESIINRLSPKVVIPMHYFITNFSSARSPLGPIHDWLKQQGRSIKYFSGKIEMNKVSLPVATEIWVMDINS